ncbi:hypothetical protein PENCOP_c006G05556 [Penicillium coprophilum]|uniref:Uncharacterized protein n=1 Tax=Penicillium coprophilum TaxID=36646 RepID=A0A1V6UNP5_9EURO|nr:hypothetical protein PENCOP_c006G05556 [Penicillium coprophilum]
MVSEKGSYVNLGNALQAPETIIVILPAEPITAPDGIMIYRTMIGSIHMSPTDGQPLGDKEHPLEVRKGGLGNLEGSFKDQEAGKVSTVKYVVRIAETEGQ